MSPRVDTVTCVICASSKRAAGPKPAKTNARPPCKTPPTLMEVWVTGSGQCFHADPACTALISGQELAARRGRHYSTPEIRFVSSRPKSPLPSEGWFPVLVASPSPTQAGSLTENDLLPKRRTTTSVWPVFGAYAAARWNVRRVGTPRSSLYGDMRRRDRPPPRGRPVAESARDPIPPERQECGLNGLTTGDCP